MSQPKTKKDVTFDPFTLHKQFLGGLKNTGGKGQLLTIWWTSLFITTGALITLFLSIIPCPDGELSCGKPELVGHDLYWLMGYLFGYLPIAWSFMEYICRLGRSKYGRYGFGL